MCGCQAVLGVVESAVVVLGVLGVIAGAVGCGKFVLRVLL